MSSNKPLIIVISWGTQNSEPEFDLAFKAHNLGKKLTFMGALPSKDILLNRRKVEKVIVIQPQKRSTYDKFKKTAEENSIAVVEIQSKEQIEQHL